jgi:hypothetical protein
MSFLVSPLTLSGIDDSDNPLRPRVDVEMPDLNRLLVAPPMPVEGLDQFELKPEQFVGVGAVNVDVILSHVPLALAQEAKSRESRRDDWSAFARRWRGLTPLKRHQRRGAAMVSARQATAQQSLPHDRRYAEAVLENERS